jgi:hypothetical protein
MSEPRRLLEQGTSFERELLESWSKRQPSNDARTKVIALAVTGAVGSGATVGAIAHSGGASVVKSTLLLKWIAIGLVGVAAAGGIFAWYASRSANPVASQTPEKNSSIRVAPIARPMSIPDAPVVPTATPIASAIPSPVTANAALPLPASPSPTIKSPQTASSTLADELARIDRAHRSLAAGNAAAALENVDAYDSLYPNGSLSQESNAIRIEALIAHGDHKAAERAASNFLAAHPTSPYAKRIRELIANH